MLFYIVCTAHSVDHQLIHCSVNDIRSVAFAFLRKQNVALSNMIPLYQLPGHSIYKKTFSI